MANRKRNIETINEVDTQTVVEETDKMQSCRIINVSNGKLHIYFEGYGIQLESLSNKTYIIGDTVKIGYSGVIGTPDFQKWIVN